MTAARRAVSAAYEISHGHSGEATSFDPDVTATVPGPAEQGAPNEFSGARIWLSYSSDTAGCHNKVFEKYSVSSTGNVTAVGDVVRLDARPGGATTGNLCEYDVDFAKSSNDLLGLGSNIIRPDIDRDDSDEEIALVVVFSPEPSIIVPRTDSNSDGV